MLTFVGRGGSNDCQVGLRGVRDHDESNRLCGPGSYAIQIDLLTVWSERQQRPSGCDDGLVLQQHDSASLRSSSLGGKVFVAGDHRSLGLIHIGLFEETKLELLQKNAARSLPDPCVRNQSVMDILHYERSEE